MSELCITGITITCDFGDKSYGQGNGRFMSVSARVPEASAGLPLSETDQVVSDGIEMYLTAWQTLLQTRYATGEISADEYKQQTAGFLVRIERIRKLYQVIKGKPVEELEEFLKRKSDDPAK